MTGGAPLAASELLDLCGLPSDAPGQAAENLLIAARLLRDERTRQAESAAAVLIASAIAACPARNVKGLPFGNDGAAQAYAGWIRAADLESSLAQLGGMVRAQFDRVRVLNAIQLAVKDYWLQEESFDDWRPGMASGSGWTTVVRTLPLGIQRAASIGQKSTLVESEPTTPPNDPLQNHKASSGDACNHEPRSHSEDADGGDPKADLDWLANVVLCAHSIQLLERSRILYPGAIVDRDYDEICGALKAWVAIALGRHSLEKYRTVLVEAAGEDDCGQYLCLMTVLLMNHPDFKEADDASFKKAMEDCLARAFSAVRELQGRVAHERVWKCLVPSPVDDDSFRDIRRYLELVGRYWEALKPVIFADLEAYVSYSPHPLMRWVVNLQSRVQKCFAQMQAVEGAEEALEWFNSLTDSLLIEGADFSCGEDGVHHLVSQLDLFLARASMAVGTWSGPLTPEERDFLQAFSRLAAEHASTIKEANAAARSALETHPIVVERHRVAEANRAKQAAQQQSQPSSAKWPDSPLDFEQFFNAPAASEPSKAPGRPRLNPQQQKALDFIKAKGPVKGVSVANHVGVSDVTFRKHYVPILREHGVKNEGKGYLVDESPPRAT